MIKKETEACEDMINIIFSCPINAHDIPPNPTKCIKLKESLSLSIGRSKTIFISLLYNSKECIKCSVIYSCKT